jgi:hypothetical protein
LFPATEPTAHKCLGEPYEERGDRETAVEHDNEFVEPWRYTDAELQPQVEGVKARIAGLVGER